MKGMVFTMLSDLVEEKFGLKVWDDVIEETSPASGGIYTSVEVYPDEELLAYVGALSKKLEVPAPDLVRAFGQYLLGRFASAHPEFFDGHDAKSFLQSVDQQIHVEVRKLHPGVILPEFSYEDTGPLGLVMHYHSPRQLCALAEGLIAGTAEKFGTPIEISHRACMLQGSPSCELALSFGEASAVAA